MLCALLPLADAAPVGRGHPQRVVDLERRPRRGGKEIEEELAVLGCPPTPALPDGFVQLGVGVDPRPAADAQREAPDRAAPAGLVSSGTPLR
jgi:hypothetical protein